MDTAWKLTCHVEDQIRAHWPAGPDAFLVAVSGGADSMLLLHLMDRLRDGMGFRLSVLHVHHGIRGVEADLDAQFVQMESARLGLPCEVMHVDAPLLAGREGLSLEDAARRLRHQAFASVLQKTGAAATVLAHHRDDQAETVLLHLLRGAAATGLCGMQALRGGLFRPLLEIPGKELRLCLASQGWSFREDSSNGDDTFRRNALRHRWIPELKAQLGHDPTGPLVRFAAMQQQDQALLSALAREAAITCRLTGMAQGQNPADAQTPAEGRNTAEGRNLAEGRNAGEAQNPAEAWGEIPDGGGVGWETLALRSLPDALARRVIVLAWEMLTGSRADLESVHVQAIWHLCRTGNRNGRVALPGFREAVLCGERCVIGGAQPPRQSVRWSHAVPVPARHGVSCRVPVPEARGILLVTRLSADLAASVYPGLRLPQQGWMQLVDSSALPAGILIRNRREGDRFRPWKAPGERTLKKWFIDQGVPAPQRHQMPLLASGENILWVIGHRTADTLLAAGGGDDILLLAWEQDLSQPQALSWEAEETLT